MAEIRINKVDDKIVTTFDEVNYVPVEMTGDTLPLRSVLQLIERSYLAALKTENGGKEVLSDGLLDVSRIKSLKFEIEI